MSTQEIYTQLENLYPTFSNTLRDKCIEYCTKYSISSLVTDLNASNIHLQSFIRGIIDIDKLEFGLVMKMFAKFGMIEQFAFMINTVHDVVEENK